MARAFLLCWMPDEHFRCDYKFVTDLRGSGEGLRSCCCHSRPVLSDALSLVYTHDHDLNEDVLDHAEALPDDLGSVPLTDRLVVPPSDGRD